MTMNARVVLSMESQIHPLEDVARPAPVKAFPELSRVTIAASGEGEILQAGRGW